MIEKMSPYKKEYKTMEEVSRVKIHYSPEFEFDRVSDMKNRLAFFREKKYHLINPEEISIDELEEFSFEKIKELTLAEYTADFFQSAVETIKDKWPTYERDFFDNLAKAGLTAESDYKILLTRYGTGGSYGVPDEVIVNITYKYDTGLIRTIAHEITHLCIQKYIDQYSVIHWQKERIVDLLMDKFLPELNRKQDVPIETEKIDEIFEQNYPNVEEIIKRAGELSKN